MLFSHNRKKVIGVLTLRVLISATVACILLGAGLVVVRLTPRRREAQRIVAIAFSLDSHLIAAALQNGAIQVWQAHSLRPVHHFRIEQQELNTLDFSPDSQLLAIAGRSLYLWRISDWREAEHLGSKDRIYGTARFDATGAVVASVNSSERIELWSVATAKRLRTLCCMALYGDVAFSPDGRLLAAAGHWPRLWEISTGREVYRLMRTRNPTFAAVAFRSDGQILATGSQDGVARIWSVSTGRELFASPARQDYIESVSFQPGGPFLAYGGRNSPVWLWNTTTQAEQLISPNATSNVSFSSDGHWLAFGLHSSVHIWDMAAGREFVRLPFPLNP
jgi:WD40 repeat protein